MSESEIISKEFLEKALGKTVESFTIKAVSDTGDNFMSILYTLDVNTKSLDGKIETLYLLSKCYPNSAGRQEFLNSQNIFWKELQFYKDFIPEMTKFQEDLDLEEIVKLDFPPFAGGDAVNFDESNASENNTTEKVFQPFDNYIMMVDLRKTWGFQMANRFLGFDIEHLALAVEAQAKLHATSWAYKQKKNLENIQSKFPTLYFDFSSEKDVQMFQGIIRSSVDEGIGALKTTLGEDSLIINALEKFKDHSQNITDIIYHQGEETEVDLDKYFRVKPTEKSHKDEIPWKVVVHGDTHLNNMMFRYNSVTNKPEQVILVDLQLCRETCPTSDLAYIVYTSTTTEFRKNHLDEVLNIYFQKFNHFCKLLKVETLPDFTLPELKRRFNRKKLFGMFMGAVCMPIFMKERENAVQLDSLEGMSQEEIFVSVGKNMSSNTKFAEKFTAFAQEMYNEGVL